MPFPLIPPPLPFGYRLGNYQKIGGPKKVELGKAMDEAALATTAGEALSLTTTKAPEPTPKAFAFTIDEDF